MPQKSKYTCTLLKTSIIGLWMCVCIGVNAANPVALSQAILQNVLTGKPVLDELRSLANLKKEELVGGLPTDAHKKVFWINMYNAFTRLGLQQWPQRFLESRDSFFSMRVYTVAGYMMSLDDIEHGVLRASEWKYGGGRIRKWFPSAWEQLIRVDTLDYRIHFALNCGAKSCPPIAYYQVETLETDLLEAERLFVTQSCAYDSTKNTLTVSKIFKWYAGDFGGKAGVFTLCKTYGVLKPGVRPRVRYARYDWSMGL